MMAVTIVRAWLFALPIAVVLGLPATAEPRFSYGGTWVTTPVSSEGVARCALAHIDGTSRVEITTDDERIFIDATSSSFFTHPNLTYAISIRLDNEAPIEVRGNGQGEHGVRLAPNEGLSSDTLLAGMARASTMTVKEDIWSNRFDLAGLADALPKLDACRKAEGERASAERTRMAKAEADKTRECDALIAKIIRDIGGKRTGGTILHPHAKIQVDCPTGEKPTLNLSSNRNGFPGEFLQLAQRLAADLVDLQPDALEGAPERCLNRVVGFYKMGKVGRHHRPSADMPRIYEGTLTMPHLTIQCHYVGTDKQGASFWIAAR